MTKQELEKVDEAEKVRDKISEKISEKGYDNLAEKIKSSTIKELQNKDKIDSWKDIFPETKGELLAIHEKAKQLKKENYNPSDYYDENVKGSFVFQPQKMADEILEQYRFKNVIGGGFYVWKDNHWQSLNEDNDLIGTEVDKRLKNETAARHRNNVRDIIKNREKVKVEKEDFKTPEGLIPFKNGVYDIKEEELKPHQPENHFTYLYEAEYRPDLENDDVDRFIQSVIPNREDDREKLREIGAFALAPWKMNQKVPILYGPGANGKTQYVKILRKIVGEDAYHKSSARKLQNDKFEMSSIIDKQLAYFDEFEDVSKPGALKTLVGDDYQNVREMRKESYTAETTVYPIFAANELPSANDDSDGFYRRWEIIDFKQKFTEEEGDGNPDRLSTKELEERYMNKDALDAFATQLVQKIKDLQDDPSFTTEQSTEDTRKIWKQKGNAIYEFINNHLEQGEVPVERGESTDDWIAKDELLEIVNKWMDHHNNSPVQKHQLTRVLNSHPDFKLRTNYRPELTDGRRPTAYAGVKLDLNQVFVKHVNPDSIFNAYASAGVMQREHRIDLDVVDSDILAKVLNYIDQSDSDSVSQFELVRELNLEISDMKELQGSDYLEIRAEQSDGFTYPKYAIRSEALDSLVEQSPNGSENARTLNSFIGELVDSWSKDTVKGYEDVVDRVAKEGFDRESVEKHLDELLDGGELYEPEPGKVAKL